MLVNDDQQQQFADFLRTVCGLAKIHFFRDHLLIERARSCQISELSRTLCPSGPAKASAARYRLDPSLKPGGEAGARTTRAQTRRSSPTLVPKPFVSPAASECTAYESRSAQAVTAAAAKVRR